MIVDHALPYIKLSISDTLVMSWLETVPATGRIEAISSFPDENTPVFYDWLNDDASCPCGLELHLWPDHPFFDLLLEKPFVQINGFPRVVFRQSPRLSARHLEAFGDILLVRNSASEGLIIVGVDTWLTATDRTFLRRLVTSDNKTG
jgi:hypothetical protein